MDINQKYLKYKTKYLHLKRLIGSGHNNNKINNNQLDINLSNNITYNNKMTPNGCYW